MYFRMVTELSNFKLYIIRKRILMNLK